MRGPVRPRSMGAGIRRAIAEAAEHLSLYQLTIEADTPFFALHKSGKLVTPDDDTARELYDVTQEVCDAAGLSAYEISNHARPARKAGTIWSIGAATNMPASVPARMAASTGRRALRDRDREAARKLADARGSRSATDSWSTRCSPARSAPTNILLMGLRLAEGIDPSAMRPWPGARSTRSASPSCLRRRGRDHRQRPAARHPSRLSDSRCRRRRSRGVTAIRSPSRRTFRRRADDLPPRRRPASPQGRARWCRPA